MTVDPEDFFFMLLCIQMGKSVVVQNADELLWGAEVW